jgi:uncharacterized membrane protein YjjP (DUF1212 family)
MDRPRHHDDPEAEVFVLDLLQALHRHGLPSYRIEDAVARVGRRLGLALEVFTLPTGLTIGIGPLGTQRVHLVRVRPGSVRLARIAELAALVEELDSGALSIATARERLAAIEAARPPHGTLAMAAAFALASAASAVFFGAPGLEVALAGAIGLLVGALEHSAGRHDRVARLLEVGAAAGAAVLAGLAAQLLGVLDRERVTLAALIVLLPGYTVTVALNELAFGHLSAGTARLGGVLSTLSLLACGAALGNAAAGALWPGTLAAHSQPSALALGVALIVAPLSFKVLFQARHRDTAWIVATSLVAWFAARAGARWGGPILGASAGSFALGIVSNVLARTRALPAAITSVPGLLVLVPGSIGFRGVASIFQLDSGPGLDLVLRMLATAVALVAGLLMAAVVYPSQRSL